MFGGYGGGGCCPEQVPPPTAKAKELVDRLRTVMFGQLLFAILMMFADPWQGIWNLLSCLFIYQGYRQLSVCNMIMVMFFNGFLLVNQIASVGTIIQDGFKVFDSRIYTGINPVYGGIVEYSSLIVYIIVIVVAFYAYREFKAISYENGGGGQLMGGFTGGRGGSYPQQTSYNNPSYTGTILFYLY